MLQIRGVGIVSPCSPINEDSAKILWIHDSLSSDSFDMAEIPKGAHQPDILVLVDAAAGPGLAPLTSQGSTYQFWGPVLPAQEHDTPQRYHKQDVSALVDTLYELAKDWPMFELKDMYLD
ncbi:hypothetical protein CBER1_08646 [Cercospora berteroae]|uniref:Uncharacterized protein n=1 Tax=Cercospora berteroae TaxID=357750 RepID=A0A2S6BVQ7_9PEZI|nr:hypothetical protein CBER1_08646 [Cercospora berteroae]